MSRSKKYTAVRVLFSSRPATTVKDTAAPQEDWWTKALRNEHLSSDDHAWMSRVDREEARLRNWRRNPSAQRCGYKRPGENGVPRFRTVEDKCDYLAWRSR